MTDDHVPLYGLDTGAFSRHVLVASAALAAVSAIAFLVALLATIF